MSYHVPNTVVRLVGYGRDMDRGWVWGLRKRWPALGVVRRQTQWVP